MTYTIIYIIVIVGISSIDMMWGENETQDRWEIDDEPDWAKFVNHYDVHHFIAYTIGIVIALIAILSTRSSINELKKQSRAMEREINARIRPILVIGADNHGKLCQIVSETGEMQLKLVMINHGTLPATNIRTYAGIQISRRPLYLIDEKTSEEESLIDKALQKNKPQPMGDSDVRAFSLSPNQHVSRIVDVTDEQISKIFNGENCLFQFYVEYTSSDIIDKKKYYYYMEAVVCEEDCFVERVKMN